MVYPTYRVWTQTETFVLEYLWNCGVGQDQEAIAAAMAICFPDGQGYGRPHQIHHRIAIAKTEERYNFAPLVSGNARRFRSDLIMECMKTIGIFYAADTETRSMDEVKFLEEIKEESHHILKHLHDDVILWMIRNSEAFSFHRWSTENKQNLIALFTLPKSPMVRIRRYSDSDLAKKMRELIAVGFVCSERTVRYFLLEVILENCRSETVRAAMGWYEGDAKQDQSSDEELTIALERLKTAHFTGSIER